MKKTILYIEDNSANRILIGRILERYDYRLLYAEDGESGLATAVENQPDLILLDIGLPDFDGQTISAMMRQMPTLADSIIVAITAWPEDKIQEMVTRYNFDGAISKPINVATFPQQVIDFLNLERA